MTELRPGESEHARAVLAEAARLLGELAMDPGCGSALTGSLVHVSLDPARRRDGAVRVYLSCRPLGNPDIDWSALRIVLHPTGSDEGGAWHLFPRLDRRGQAVLRAAAPAEYALRVYRAAHAGGGRAARTARDRAAAGPVPAGTGDLPARRVVARGEAGRAPPEHASAGEPLDVVLKDGDLTITLSPHDAGTRLRLSHPDPNLTARAVELLIVGVNSTGILATMTLVLQSAGADGCCAETILDRPLDGSFEVVHRRAGD